MAERGVRRRLVALGLALTALGAPAAAAASPAPLSADRSRADVSSR